MIVPVAVQNLGPVQAAVYARLVGDAELLALLGGRAAVYDEVPEGVPRPYVTFGPGVELPDNDLCSFGGDTTETLHVWSTYRGNAEALAIAARIRALLDHRPLAVTGHRVIAVRWEITQTHPDPDPTIRHASIRFRIITEQE